MPVCASALQVLFWQLMPYSAASFVSIEDKNELKDHSHHAKSKLSKPSKPSKQNTTAKKFQGALKIIRKHAGAGAMPPPPSVTWCKIYCI